VGIGTPVALLVGMLLVLGSVGLFFFDKIRPAYARDSDKVYAAFILITGLVTLVNWGMDAGPSFLMFLMSGMLTTLLIESIRNREPIVIDPMSPLNRRPPSPRYDERPPVSRGYRAEIDRDPYREPIDLPAHRQANQARMNPAQESAWRNDRNEYADGSIADNRARPRQPYEEYRGPAGRLQPSANGPEDRYANSGGYNARPPSNNRPPERPQERPPERPSERPQERPPERFPEGARNNAPRNGSPDFQSRPPERRPSERSIERPSERPQERPPERPPERSQERPDGMPAERPANGERALNVRPYSEAPKLDLPSDSI
jgi:hypothetical protein